MKFKDTKYGNLTGQTYKGNIDVHGMNLASLEGSPKVVIGIFNCSRNKDLTSLKGAPETVKGDFYCSNNQSLTSLEGAPKNIKGSFWCFDNPKLTSLKGAPKSVSDNFNCFNNPKLKSLEGAPESVGGNFNCASNPKLTQPEVDKLVKCDIKGKINMPEGLTAPTKEDYALYKKLGDRKYWKLKSLKDSL